MVYSGMAKRKNRAARAAYPSDLTDAQWALIAPLIPPAEPGGRARSQLGSINKGANAANTALTSAGGVNIKGHHVAVIPQFTPPSLG